MGLFSSLFVSTGDTPPPGEIDYARLRADMLADCYGAAFGAGIGLALLDAGAVEDADSQELLRLAQKYGYSLKHYRR